LRAEVTAFEDHALPLDLLNLDTGWHVNSCFLEQQKCHGPTPTNLGYGGIFEWDSNLFPSPQPVSEWLAEYNLSSYLDIHQCPGVLKENAQYAKMAAALGMSAANISAGVPIPVRVEDRNYNKLFFETMLEPQVGSWPYYW
jgi:hypothetical protein